LVEPACVTDVVRTVTLPGPAAQVVSHSSGTGAGSHGSGGDGEHRDGDDHGDEHDD
jgi:hypothetical protein